MEQGNQDKDSGGRYLPQIEPGQQGASLSPKDILLGLDFERSNPDVGLVSLEKGGGDDDVRELETPQIRTSTKPK